MDLHDVRARIFQWNRLYITIFSQFNTCIYANNVDYAIIIEIFSSGDCCEYAGRICPNGCVKIDRWEENIRICSALSALHSQSIHTPESSSSARWQHFQYSICAHRVDAKCFSLLIFRDQHEIIFSSHVRNELLQLWRYVRAVFVVASINLAWPSFFLPVCIFQFFVCECEYAFPSFHSPFHFSWIRNVSLFTVIEWYLCCFLCSLFSLQWLSEVIRRRMSNDFYDLWILLIRNGIRTSSLSLHSFHFFSTNQTSRYCVGCMSRAYAACMSFHIACDDASPRLDNKNIIFFSFISFLWSSSGLCYYYYFFSSSSFRSKQKYILSLAVWVVHRGRTITQHGLYYYGWFRSSVRLSVFFVVQFSFSSRSPSKL